MERGRERRGAVVVMMRTERGDRGVVVGVESDRWKEGEEGAKGRWWWLNRTEGRRERMGGGGGESTGGINRGAVVLVNWTEGGR